MKIKKEEKILNFAWKSETVKVDAILKKIFLLSNKFALVRWDPKYFTRDKFSKR